MALGDDWTLPVPAVGTSGTGYATQVNAVLQELIDRVSYPLDISGISWGADADLENHGLSNAAFVSLYDQSAVSDEVGTVHSYGGELYFISASGAVQITLGGALNAAGIGGIVGDYGSPNPAAVAFIDAGAVYEFYDDYAAGTFAGLKGLSFSVASPGVAAAATVDFGGSANVTYTLPPAAPAAVALLRMEADGDIVTSGTVATALTMSADLILSGTAKVQHGSRTLGFPVPAEASTNIGNSVAPDPANAVYRFGVWRYQGGGANTLYFLLPPLEFGKRLTGVSLRCYQDAGASDWTFQVYRQTVAASVKTSTSLGSTTFNTIALPAADRIIVLDVTDSTIGAAGNERFIARVDVPAGMTGELYGIDLHYDCPA